MCMEDLGALIFFVDPLSAHPHQADIDSLIRLANCGNVIVCPNPTSAMSMMHTLKCALQKGSRGMVSHSVPIEMHEFAYKGLFFSLLLRGISLDSVFLRDA